MASLERKDGRAPLNKNELSTWVAGRLNDSKRGFVSATSLEQDLISLGMDHPGAALQAADAFRALAEPTLHAETFDRTVFEGIDPVLQTIPKDNKGRKRPATFVYNSALLDQRTAINNYGEFELGQAVSIAARILRGDPQNPKSGDGILYRGQLERELQAAGLPGSLAPRVISQIIGRDNPTGALQDLPQIVEVRHKRANVPDVSIYANTGVVEKGEGRDSDVIRRFEQVEEEKAAAVAEAIKSLAVTPKPAVNRDTAPIPSPQGIPDVQGSAEIVSEQSAVSAGETRRSGEVIKLPHILVRAFGYLLDEHMTLMDAAREMADEMRVLPEGYVPERIMNVTNTTALREQKLKEGYDRDIMNISAGKFDGNGIRQFLNEAANVFIRVADERSRSLSAAGHMLAHEIRSRLISGGPDMVLLAPMNAVHAREIIRTAQADLAAHETVDIAIAHEPQYDPVPFSEQFIFFWRNRYMPGVLTQHLEAIQQFASDGNTVAAQMLKLIQDDNVPALQQLQNGANVVNLANGSTIARSNVEDFLRTRLLRPLITDVVFEDLMKFVLYAVINDIRLGEQERNEAKLAITVFSRILTRDEKLQLMTNSKLNEEFMQYYHQQRKEKLKARIQPEIDKAVALYKQIQHVIDEDERNRQGRRGKGGKPDKKHMKGNQGKDLVVRGVDAEASNTLTAARLRAAELGQRFRSYDDPKPDQLFAEHLAWTLENRFKEPQREDYPSDIAYDNAQIGYQLAHRWIQYFLTG